MKRPRTFSCFLIGEGSLLLQCAEHLQSEGHELRGVISRDPSVQQWASDNGLPWTGPTSDLRAFLGAAPFDHLFSITNPTVLPAEILRLPRGLAVNYHDALLPRYGGTCATSWALMAREPTHGITWHVMAERVDLGDILKQVEVEVEPGETALSLNFKCYEAASAAFVELIDELTSGRISRTPQDASRRSFFARARRPPAACVIDWSQSAEEIDALGRALDFGSYVNPLGLPKIQLGDHFYVAQDCELLPAPATASAGTLVGADASALTVATTTGHLAIRRILTVTGEPRDLSGLIARLGLRPGTPLPRLSPELAARLTELHRALARHEEEWVARLGASRPAAIPNGRGTGSRPSGGAVQLQEETLPTGSPELLAALPDGPPGELLLTALLLSLARRNTPPFDVGLTTKQLQRQVWGLERLFSPVVPLPVPAGATLTFSALRQHLQGELAQLAQRATFALDVFARFPALRRTPPTDPEARFPIVIQRVPTLEDAPPVPTAPLALTVPDDGRACRWRYDPGVLERQEILRLTGEMAELLRPLLAASR